MEKNRIVTELFLEKPSYKVMSDLAKSFEKAGIRAIVLPPEERGINTHIVIENPDLPKVRARVRELGIRAIEKEVLLVVIENKPGTFAYVSSKIAEKGINISYVFLVAFSPELTYALVSTTDNKTALKAFI